MQQVYLIFVSDWIAVKLWFTLCWFPQRVLPWPFDWQGYSLAHSSFIISKGKKTLGSIHFWSHKSSPFSSTLLLHGIQSNSLESTWHVHIFFNSLFNFITLDLLQHIAGLQTITLHAVISWSSIYRLVHLTCLRNGSLSSISTAWWLYIYIVLTVQSNLQILITF